MSKKQQVWSKKRLNLGKEVPLPQPRKVEYERRAEGLCDSRTAPHLARAHASSLRLPQKSQLASRAAFFRPSKAPSTPRPAATRS
eukprot:5995224-Pleurochrysis_carterae.AAC.1